MKLIIDVVQSPDGRLTGFAVAAGGQAPRPFSGAMELVARVEELCQAAAMSPDTTDPRSHASR
jgi:hypothetical protein